LASLLVHSDYDRKKLSARESAALSKQQLCRTRPRRRCCWSRALFLPSPPLLPLRASLALEMIRHARVMLFKWRTTSLTTCGMYLFPPAHPLLMHRPDCQIAAVPAGIVIAGQSAKASDVMVLYASTTGVNCHRARQPLVQPLCVVMCLKPAF